LDLASALVGSPARRYLDKLASCDLRFDLDIFMSEIDKIETSWLIAPIMQVLQSR
jgi:hypothetical protein